MSISKIYHLALLWAEVWPLVIFLLIFFLTKQKNKDLVLPIWYLIITLVLAIPANISSNYNDIVPDGFRNNSIIYNTNAFLKVIFIGSYIIRLKPLAQYRYTKPLIFAFIIFTLIDFAFFESITNSMGKHFFSVVSIVLLILCMTYFLTSIVDDEVDFGTHQPGFLICTGVALFEAINFFVFLFIYDLYISDIKISIVTRDISNWSYLVSYCLFTIAVCNNSTWRWKINTDKKLFSSNA